MLDSTLKAAVLTFIQREKLPDSYLQTVEQWFMPMVEELLMKIAHSTEPVVVGVSGCQGSGKSTLASLLVILLKHSIGLRAINLSLDDFYLTHAHRAQLAKKVHPLFVTRGVPGTHDVALAIEAIDALKRAGQVAIPRFDKSSDDREPEHKWPVIAAPVDVIVLEGWCLGIGAQQECELEPPVNSLETEEDSQGTWRRYVNAAIKQEYTVLYDLVDYLIMLKAPSFEKVFDWRQTQEDKLIAKQNGAPEDIAGSKMMSPDQLRRFIQHYERITRHGLATLPAQADVVFELTNQQSIARRI